MHARTENDVLIAEDHADLLGKNIFYITMFGAIGFFLGCFAVYF